MAKKRSVFMLSSSTKKGIIKRKWITLSEWSYKEVVIRMRGTYETKGITTLASSEYGIDAI